jgi:hypothetical protein
MRDYWLPLLSWSILHKGSTGALEARSELHSKEVLLFVSFLCVSLCMCVCVCVCVCIIMDLDQDILIASKVV